MRQKFLDQWCAKAASSGAASAAASAAAFAFTTAFAVVASDAAAEAAAAAPELPALTHRQSKNFCHISFYSLLRTFDKKVLDLCQKKSS